MTRNPLLWCASVAVLILAVVVSAGYWMVATEAASALHAWGEAPALLAARVSALQGSVDALPGKVLPPVLAQVHQISVKADKQITALRSETLARVDTLSGTLDTRMAGALAIVKTSAENADTQIAGMRADLKPVLREVSALVKDSQDSLDDLYPDFKASVESGTVAMRGVAETAEAVGKSTPAIALSVNGIAADFHTATTDLVKPKSFWQRVKAWLETAGRIGARFI